MKDNENGASLRGMIVLDQSVSFLVSITGKDSLYTLNKDDINCLHIFEPLSRFEFRGSLSDSDQVYIDELIRFDNVLKINHKIKIEALLGQLQFDLSNRIADMKLLNELQKLFKEEHIPFSVLGFDKLRSLFWQVDLSLKIDEVEQSEPGENRETLVERLNKRKFMFEQNKELYERYQNILSSFTDTAPTPKDVFDRDHRILLDASEVPEVGDCVEYPFLNGLGEVLISKIGKSFFLKNSSTTVSNAVKNRLKGKLVCWVYYEPKDKKLKTGIESAEDNMGAKLKPRSINELEGCFDRIKKLFILDGIKPRNSNSYISDFRTGVEICDMRHLSKQYWFVLSADNIWYLDSTDSTALMHHNIQLGGKSYLGYVLSRNDYQDIAEGLEALNESLIDIRKKMMDFRI